MGLLYFYIVWKQTEDILVDLSRDGPLPTDFRTEEQRVRSKTDYRLSQKGSLHILKWRDI